MPEIALLVPADNLSNSLIVILKIILPKKGLNPLYRAFKLRDSFLNA